MITGACSIISSTFLIETILHFYSEIVCYTNISFLHKKLKLKSIHHLTHVYKFMYLSSKYK